MNKKRTTNAVEMFMYVQSWLHLDLFHWKINKISFL